MFQQAVPAVEVIGNTSKMLVCGKCTDFRTNPECKRLFSCILMHIATLQKQISYFNLMWVVPVALPILLS